MSSICFFIVIFFSFSGLAVSQPVPKTSWMQVNERPISNVITSYPRSATFSTGEYVVVYSVSLGASNSAEIAAKIYRIPSSVKVPEFILSSTPSTSGSHYAPNVIVLPGDIAVVIWRTRSTQYPFYVSQFDSFGNLFGSYGIQIEGLSSTNAPEDILGLISLNSSSVFGFTMPPSTASARAVGFMNVGQSVPTELLTLPTDETPAVLFDARSNSSCYVTKQTNTTTYLFYSGYKPSGLIPQKLITQLFSSRHTVPFLIDLPDIRLFVHTEKFNSNVYFTVLNEATKWMSTLSLFNTSNVRYAMRPSVVHLGSNYVVVAHSAKSTEVEYRYMRITPSRVDYLGPIMAPDGHWSSDSVDMALVQNAIIMVALDPEQTQVMMRVMSQCGNGILDVNEQCDGSDDCTGECTCLDGMEYRDGKCFDVCGNGIVTGSEDCEGGPGCNMTACKCQPGYQPFAIRKQCRTNPVEFVPNISPSLDCLDIIDNDSMTLYFSFVSNHEFDLTISLGDMNKFIPSNLAGDRPTFFKTGNSLTYPVSPYSLTIPRSTTEVTWQLGSNSLVVDLSGDKIQLLQCHTSASFILNVASSYKLTDSDIDILVDNIADKYSISKTRLSASYILSVNGSETTPNIYSVSITIAPPTGSEKSSQEIVKDLFSGVKNSTQQLNIELSLGITEKNPHIKEVIPGAIVRDQERGPQPISIGTDVSPSLASSDGELQSGCSASTSSWIFLASLFLVHF